MNNKLTGVTVFEPHGALKLFKKVGAGGWVLESVLRARITTDLTVHFSL